MSEIFPVVASDQYTEKIVTETLAPRPPLSIIRQLPVSSTAVRYTFHDKEIYSKKDIKVFTKSSVKSPIKLLGLRRLRA